MSLQKVAQRKKPSGAGHNSPNPALGALAGHETQEDHLTATVLDLPPGPSAPDEGGIDVLETLPEAQLRQCHIERLQPEIMETIFSCLIGISDEDHRSNRTLVKGWMLVCRRWSAVASRLALVTIRTSRQHSTDQVIEYAKRLLDMHEGWAPTRSLRISHSGEGTIHRLPELIELFGRTLYKLDIKSNRRKYDAPYPEGNFPTAVEGQLFLPMLQTLDVWEISSKIVQECLRHSDPTKLKTMSLTMAREHSPEEGFLNGTVYPRLESLKLGALLFGGESTLEDLKHSTPALKYLRIATSETALPKLVDHMEQKWPATLRRLEVGVWDIMENVTRDDPVLRRLVALAEEKKLGSIEIEVRVCMTSWTVSMKQKGPAGTPR